MIKYFTIGFIGLILAGILFGVVLPALFSAQDDFAVMLGFAIAAALIYFGGLFAIKGWNRIRKVKEGGK